MATMPRSEFRPHTPDSPCLVAVDEVTKGGTGLPDPLPPNFKKPEMVREPGWFLCREQNRYIHTHDGRFYAHLPGERVCPLHAR